MPNLRSISLVLYTLLLALVAQVCVLLDPTRKVYGLLARFVWAPMMLRLAGVKVRTTLPAGIDWSRPFVVCSNHQSQLDIPLLLACLPTGLRFLAKRSLFFIPVFGWSMFLAGFVPVDRASHKRTRESIGRAAKSIRKGPSVVVFPEGTRTHDGTMTPFKSGAFVLALRAQVPVLPVAIVGMFDIVPRTRLGVHPGNVELRVGTPIETVGLSAASRDELRNQTQAAVRALLER
jgi:1-acyl-sn-glycerol-3-phosphate acyltransferase